MQDYQQEFIQFALSQKVLDFGEFTLKSGRTSPYFFNAGLFNSGKALAQLGQFYAAAIQASKLTYDVLFGPAYKGIPLVSAAAIALAKQYNIDVGYCFNRKETKDHGEGGLLVGAKLQGRVLIIDDVITAGTATRESIKMITEAGASVAGIVVALNRQERGQGKLSTIQEIEQTFQIPVISIISLSDLLEYLQHDARMTKTLEKLRDYREAYGASL